MRRRHVALYTDSSCVGQAGWVGMVTNVTPNLMPATFTADQHLFAMIGSGPNAPW